MGALVIGITSHLMSPLEFIKKPLSFLHGVTKYPKRMNNSQVAEEINIYKYIDQQ